MNYTLAEARGCVGPGWAPLIARIFDILPEDAHISQIKEKFGGLRFYVDNVDEGTYALIDRIEREGLTVCEECGKPGKLRNSGWWKTLCEEHNAERQGMG